MGRKASTAGGRCAVTAPPALTCATKRANSSPAATRKTRYAAWTAARSAGRRRCGFFQRGGSAGAASSLAGVTGRGP